jgi:hypothetical protein
MLKKQLEKHIAKALNTDEREIRLFPEEKEYSLKHQLLSSDLVVVELDVRNRFSDAVIERCHKETEELIASETLNFLKQPLAYLKVNLKEFLFVESTSLVNIGVDSIALEFDEVFERYTAMLGLKLQKKFGAAIKTHFDDHLLGDEVNYSVLFSDEDGLWHVNFPINNANHFQIDMSLEDAFELIYHFLFTLVVDVEGKL